MSPLDSGERLKAPWTSWYSKLQVEFKIEGVLSIFEGVMALLDLEINNNISFRTISWPFFYVFRSYLVHSFISSPAQNDQWSVRCLASVVRNAEHYHF